MINPNLEKLEVVGQRQYIFEPCISSTIKWKQGLVNVNDHEILNN